MILEMQGHYVGDEWISRMAPCPENLIQDSLVYYLKPAVNSRLKGAGT